MTENTWLAERFEAHRAHLRTVAGGKIAEIEILAESETLRRLEVKFVEP